MRKFFISIDWKILIFLLLFLNVKVVVKLIAVIIICLLHFNFKFGFRFRNSRLPLFYLIIIGIGFINYFLTGGFTSINYNLAFLTGITFWLFCIIGIHQVKLSIERNEQAVIDKTIQVFFIINAIISLSAFLSIVFKTGHVNPYLYQGEYQKYFIGTGDYIKGISFDTSTTNAVFNAFGVIYFLYHKKVRMVLLCMVILLLTGSNISNILLCSVLLFVFIFQSSRDQKSIILICLLLLVIFMTKVSPQNNQYLVNSYNELFNKDDIKQAAPKLSSLKGKPENELIHEEQKQKFAMLYLDSLSRIQQEKQKNKTQAKTFVEKLSVPRDSIHTPAFQHRSLQTPVEANMFHFIITHPVLPISTNPDFNSTLPGKFIAWKQTVSWLRQHPQKIVTGGGMGNFSSKLAFRTSCIKVAGSYPERFKYINDDFLSNHLYLYLFYFSKEDKFHSIINNPSSVYDQLISEYGLSGLLAFFIFYLGFFLRNFKKLTYGIPLILLLTGIFFIDYWFEQLSVVILFELMLFLNIKEKTQQL